MILKFFVSHQTQKKNKKRCHDLELIKEATTTMRNMSHLATRKSANSNIDTFCQFVASELYSVLESSNITYVKRAKREIQTLLFNIWDEIDVDQRPSSLKNYSLRESSPVQNEPEIDADQRASSLKNYSFKDSSSVQKNDTNTSVTIPVKKSGNPKIIILKQNLYKPKPKYTLTAAASEEIVVESDVQSFVNCNTESD